ncbi:hypothetical protein [Ekhidna sp.]|uniref:hypothetical protein n=1 Tax=Ekhidna sp. TaxID=2608089 RepID=UPI003CCBE928
MDLFTRFLSVLLTAFSFFATAQMALENTYREEAATESPMKDFTAPRTDLLRTGSGGFVFGPATRIKFKIIEEESGVKTTYFKVADHPYMKSDGRQMMPHDLPDGSYRMLYYSVDKEGNQEQVRRDTIYIDKMGPSVYPHFNNSPLMFENGLPVLPKGTGLVIEVADEHTDVQKVTYKINDGVKTVSKDLHSIDLSEKLTNIQDEIIKIEVTSYDSFYNISKEVISFKILR